MNMNDWIFGIITAIGVVFSILFSVYTMILNRRQFTEDKRLEILPYIIINTDSSSAHKPVPRNYNYLNIISKEFNTDLNEYEDVISYPIKIKNVGSGNALEVAVKEISLCSDNHKKYKNFGVYSDVKIFDFLSTSDTKVIHLEHPYVTPIDILNFDFYTITLSFKDVLDNCYEQTFKYSTKLTDEHNKYIGSVQGDWGNIDINATPPKLKTKKHS